MSQAPGVLPSGLGDAVDRDVAKIRDATARFKTTEAAEAAGYKRVTDCVEYQPAGAMGYHFQNNALLDATLDVDHPEVLVYEKKPDGAFKLNGVEFLVPISAWTPAEPPRIWGKLSKRRIAWASGTSTSGRGSRVRAVYLPTGTPTSSAGTLIDAIIRSPGPRDSTGRPV
jgi:hypothetical protein